MYAYDFIYDGNYLSDFGFIVCEFNGNGNVSSADTGSEISFNTVPIGNGSRFSVTGTRYDTALKTKFQICKNPAMFPEAEMEITSEEFRALSRWLNRKEFLWFHSCDWCEPERQKPWFRASFTLTRMDSGGATYGIELDMVTDAPFGYGEEITEEFEFTDGELSLLFSDDNDEIGETYPALKITCGASGTLTLSNDRTGCACTIENCVSGEVITFSGDTQIIKTSSTTHDIANDFNYDFFRFGNTFDDVANTITVSMPCTVEMTYRPIQKDTL